MRGDVQIQVEELVKRFTLPTGMVTAVDRVSFEVREGEFFCIVGPSGCGKTTILRILAGLEAKSAGDVAIHYQQSGRPRPALPRCRVDSRPRSVQCCQGGCWGFPHLAGHWWSRGR